MPICNTLVEILKTCEPFNSGGIYRLLINDSSNQTYLAASASTHMITGLTYSTDFVEFEFNRNVGSVLSSTKIDFANGSSYPEVTATLVLARREAAKSRAIQILGEGQRFLDIIYQDANKNWWFIDHAQLATDEEDSGTAKADGSKYTITFRAEMDNKQYGVPAEIIPTLLA